MRKILILILALSFVVSGCALETHPYDVGSGEIDEVPDGIKHDKDLIVDFSLKVLEKNYNDENLLISPLSIVSALAMVTNGAKDNTLLEIEKTLGISKENLNNYLEETRKLPNEEKYQLNIANSIWIKDKENLVIKDDFLETNKKYYDADVYMRPFDDSTRSEINSWVNIKTEGMIETLLEEAPPEDAIMYLINALSFDAEWQAIYEDTEIHKGIFKSKRGEQEVEFMNSTEYLLENEYVTGFIKPYKDVKYSFIALLPKEDVSVKDLFSLDSTDISKLIREQEKEEVSVSIPKFSTTYDISLNDSLKELGIKDAFDEDRANFTNMGSSDGNIYINNVIHKTKIDVDEKGTKAGAVTGIEMFKTTSIAESKSVILDRPFMYMIVDTSTNFPIFIGSLMDVGMEE